MARREAAPGHDGLEPVALVDDSPRDDAAPVAASDGGAAPAGPRDRRRLVAAVAAAALAAVVVASLTQNETDSRDPGSTVPATDAAEPSGPSPTTLRDDTQSGGASGYFGPGLDLEGELVTAGRDGMRVIDLATGAVRRDEAVRNRVDVVLTTPEGTLLARTRSRFAVRTSDTTAFTELDADIVALAPPDDLWVHREDSTEWRRLRDDRVVDTARRPVIGATAHGFVTTDERDRLFVDPYDAGAAILLAASPARLLATSADRVAFVIVHECTAACPVHVRDLGTGVEIDWFAVQARPSLLADTHLVIDSAAFSPDGTRLAIAREGASREAPEHVDLVDLTDGREFEHPYREVPTLQPGTHLWDRTEIVTSRATWTPNSDGVAIIGNDRRLWVLPFADDEPRQSDHEFASIASIATTSRTTSPRPLDTTRTRPTRQPLVPGAGDARIAFVTSNGRGFREIRLESGSYRELQLPTPEPDEFGQVYPGQASRTDDAWIVPISGTAVRIGDDDRITALGPATRVLPSPRGHWLLSDVASGTEVREYAAGTLSPLLATLHQPVYGSVSDGLVTVVASDPTVTTRFVSFDPYSQTWRELPVAGGTQDDTGFAGRHATVVPNGVEVSRARTAIDLSSGRVVVDALARYPFALSSNGRWLIAVSVDGPTRYDLERGTSQRLRLSRESEWRIADNGTVVALDYERRRVSIIAPGETRRIDFSNDVFLGDEQWALG